MKEDDTLLMIRSVIHGAMYGKDGERAGNFNLDWLIESALQYTQSKDFDAFRMGGDDGEA